MEKFFTNTKYLILNTFLFLFPLFFLTTTREFFVTNKLYLLSFTALFLFLVSGFHLLYSKKITWNPKSLDLPITVFIVAVALSLVFSSTNKIQAILNPNFGLLMFLSLGVLYFFLSRTKDLSTVLSLFRLTGVMLSIFSIVFFFQPFKNVSLTLSWQFLKNPGFTPLGNQIDLAIFLGFTLVINVYFLLGKTKNPMNRILITNYLFLVLNSLALFLTIYSLFKNPPLFPPFSLSWYGVLEVMKNFRTAVFGIGIDNFSQLFTKVKDLAYNQTELWSIAGFNVARNTIFHLVAEAGIIGLATFVFMLFTALKNTINHNSKQYIWLFAYLLICLFVFPPTLVIFFLLFIVLSFIASIDSKHDYRETNLDDFPFLLYGLFLIIAGSVAVGGYLLGRSYAAEYSFKQAADKLGENNIKEVYDNLRRARILNPYQESYVLNFSQTNLIIADSIARKDPEKITETDRQTIAQAVQAAISEAKELVRLNPNKAVSFENLGNVYRNIIPIANGADVWTVSSYQRAIILDPSNPTYRLGLGGVYYLLGRYADAVKLFEQATSLKPDWPNAYYNLAWAYFQNQEFDKAAAAMQNVINLVDKNSSPADWEKANKDLEDFKNKLANIDREATEGSQLNLPEKSTNELDPKLKLPPEAAPDTE